MTRPISAALRPDGEITGTVTGPGGKALTGICVRAVSQGRQASRFLAVTSASGGYQLGPLRPGRYLVEFLAGGGASGYKSQRWKNASSARATTPFSSGPAEPSPASTRHWRAKSRPRRPITKRAAAVGNLGQAQTAWPSTCEPAGKACASWSSSARQ